MSSLTDRLVAAGRALTRPGRPPEQPLSIRLTAVADFVTPGARLADIGTDHGWLPIHLVHTRHAHSAIAADLREQPLQGARKRIADHNLTKRIDTRLGNGLTVLAPGEASVVAIAGMGGRRIVELVAAAPAVIQSLDRLVVQPNTEVYRVRQGLRAAGLELIDESLVFDDGHWYTTLCWIPGQPQVDWTELDLHYGPLLRQRADPQLRRFLGGELTRVARVLARARHNGAKAESLASLQQELEAIEGELARLAIVAGTIQKA